MGLAQSLQKRFRLLTSGMTAVKLKKPGAVHVLGTHILPAQSASIISLRYDPELLRKSDVRLQAVKRDGSVLLERKLYPPRDKPIRLYAEDRTEISLQLKAVVLKKNRPIKFEIASSVQKVLDLPVPAPSIFHEYSRTVTIPTYPARQRTLVDALDSLLGQCDQVMLYLNGYDAVPPFIRDRLSSGKLHYVLDPRGDLRAAAKFHWAHNRGYHFLCDDDIIYPPDYIDRHIDAIERYERRAVTGLLGGIYEAVVTDAYRSKCQSYRFHEALELDTPVHVLGTGTVGFHADTVRNVEWSRFRHYPAANDEAFAVEARRLGIPLIAIARTHQWLKSHPEMHYGLFEERQRDSAIRIGANEMVARLNPWSAPTWPARLNSA